MAIMIPNRPHAFAPASLEGVMFTALEKLPDEYYVFHSLRLSTVVDNTFHESETEPFLTEVFYGCSYEVYFFVNDQETVVRFAESPDYHRCILRVMLVNVQLKLFGNLAGVDCCCY